MRTNQITYFTICDPMQPGLCWFFINRQVREPGTEKVLLEQGILLASVIHGTSNDRANIVKLIDALLAYTLLEPVYRLYETKRGNSEHLLSKVFDITNSDSVTCNEEALLGGHV